MDRIFCGPSLDSRNLEWLCLRKKGNTAIREVEPNRQGHGSCTSFGGINVVAGNVTLIDTQAVPLSPQGHAEFHGKIELPGVCEHMAFLIRMANPSPIIDRGIAYGAVRQP